MPSPPESTVPTSATSIAFSYPASSRFRISVISSALISISDLRSLAHLLPEPFDRILNRRVEDFAADPRDEPAQDLLVDLHRQANRSTDPRGHRSGHRGALAPPRGG